MSEEEHLFYFSSKYSKQDQFTGGFTTNLPFPLNLEGEWKCAVLDFYIKTSSNNRDSIEFIYILGDFCKTSFIQEKKEIPLLKKVPINKKLVQQYSFTNLLYIPLKQSTLSDFDLTFLDTSFHPYILDKSSLIECTIHFIKNGG